MEQSSPCPKRGQGQKPGSWQGKEILALQRALGRQGLEGLREVTSEGRALFGVSILALKRVHSPLPL